MGLVKNILVAPDSFKGSMSSMVAAQCMCSGISKVFPDALLKAIPVADGGEGTIDAMIFAVQGDVKSFTVTGSLGEKVNARIGFLPDNTAVVEMAQASGLTLVNSSFYAKMIREQLGADITGIPGAGAAGGLGA